MVLKSVLLYFLIDESIDVLFSRLLYNISLSRYIQNKHILTQEYIDDLYSFYGITLRDIETILLKEGKVLEIKKYVY